ncbi:MAG: AAA family ATPase, partial [Bacteroidota bacterium]
IVGQEQMVDLLVTAILADGHVLIEGVPGVAKTLTAKLLSKTISVNFSRIQFTPDLMPSDVLGTSIYNLKKSEFEFKSGPIFSNIVLIDEINRAPAKTQSALFEVMEERQVTVDGTTYRLDPPYIVVATQNPIEHEGTYRLPEAQLDRFLFKIQVDYPTLDQEVAIINGHHQRKGTAPLSEVNAVLSAAQIQEYRNTVQQVYIEEHLIRYIAQIIHETRNNPSLFLGASPRASMAVLNGAKAFAAINGRDFVTPEDIKFIALPVLRHRVILTPDKEMEGITTDEIVKQIVDKIEIPR